MNTYLSIKELISVPILSTLHISEDGDNVAFVKRTADWEENAYRHHIWIHEKEKGQSCVLNEGTSPLWSRDSRQLAYLRTVGGGNQIFIESLDGHGSVQVTDEEEGVISFKWEPGGKGFYYLARSKQSEEIKRRKEKYGDFHHVGKEGQNHCLYYVDLQNHYGVAHPLTDGKNVHVLEFDVSADGEKVVLLGTPSPDGEDDQNGELYLLDRQSGTEHKLKTNKLLGGNVCFSPDGKKICYTASIRERDYYKNRIGDRTLEIYDLTSGETIQPLTDFDSTVASIRWTAKGILIMWQEKTNDLIGFVTGDGKVDVLSEPIEGCTMDASITGDGNHLVYSKALLNETFEVYLDDEKITDENRLFEGKRRSKRKIVSWQSHDGLEIEGVLSTPADFDETKTYPLLVMMHGGPAWAAFPIHSGCFNDKYPVEPLIEKGFIVLEPNYRGSSGYGNEFLKANYRNLGIGDYEDVISGVDALVDRGIADRDRVGVMGWSQGGYISAFCSTYSDRFKAVSVGGGMSDWMTNYVNTDLPSFIRMHVGDTPWNDPEIYAKASPINYVKSASTPTLIQHGEQDRRVPVANAYELYKGLKDVGVETELVIFKGMGYSSDKPGMHVAIMKQNLMWFSHYLLGESMDGFRE
ncbi:S9 family peptidase [Rossellomorea aquimaris]|uniref:S9 family peptidase n=1 Tax=Rossellomorea aquimaris TaxID=189382 RepID=UPI001CD36C4B|nr:S9 family peptidase [Rossellomorea aquimaris]MCA1054258.1 S9 family peptidase [Rossellomorea aquimaris]